MKYLLDTDHISILQRQAGVDYQALAERIALHSSEELALSVVSFHEQVLGCHTYISRARMPADPVRGYRMLSRLWSDYAAVAVLPLDEAAASVLEDLVAGRLRIGTMDLRIAAIALSRGLILVTRNARDFGKVPNLRIEDWTS